MYLIIIGELDCYLIDVNIVMSPLFDWYCKTIGFTIN